MLFPRHKSFVAAIAIGAGVLHSFERADCSVLGRAKSFPRKARKQQGPEKKREEEAPQGSDSRPNLRAPREERPKVKLPSEERKWLEKKTNGERNFFKDHTEHEEYQKEMRGRRERYELPIEAGCHSSGHRPRINAGWELARDEDRDYDGDELGMKLSKATGNVFEVTLPRWYYEKRVKPMGTMVHWGVEMSQLDETIGYSLHRGDVIESEVPAPKDYGSADFVNLRIRRAGA